MKYLQQKLAALAVLAIAAVSPIQTPSATAQTDVEAWRQGLSGSLLAALNGSVHSSNSSLTTLDLCRSGRYRYAVDSSYSGGSFGGAAQSGILGQWDVASYQGRIYFVYRTDQGQQGSYPMYLMSNGKVNIGGTAFSVSQGGARC